MCTLTSYLKSRSFYLAMSYILKLFYFLQYKHFTVLKVLLFNIQLDLQVS